MLDKLKEATPHTSTLLTFVSAIAGIADQLTQTGDPRLAIVGLVIAAVFKAVEGYVQGKKLDVEQQMVHTSGAIPPSVVVSARKAGLEGLPMMQPEVKLDAPAPGVKEPVGTPGNPPDVVRSPSF